ncbi:MAG: hypothetical protein IT324_01375 [Anaerolineae bacterium]|nr:hypothetical protein [Anaerolineae bacterium]
MVTPLLEKAIAEITKLPEQEQNTLAAWILEELESEERWQRAFDASEDVLTQLAEEALREHREGRTLPLDPDTL